MNRKRTLLFLAAVGAFAVVLTVIYSIVHETPDVSRNPLLEGAPAKTAMSAESAPTLAPSRGTALAPIRPKSFTEPGSLSSDVGLGGIVVDEAGLPIEGASCELFDDVSAMKERTQEGDVRDHQKTNSEGLFFFDRTTLAPGQYVLKVMHPRYVTERKAIDPRKAEPVITVRMHAGTAISGTVLTAAGAPLASATISVFDMGQNALDPNGSVEGLATTDAAGAYTVAHVAPGIKRVQASLAGYATQDRQALQLELAKPLANVDFALNDGASISGQVFSTEGQPISGAFVTARVTRIGPIVAPTAELRDQPRDRAPKDPAAQTPKEPDREAVKEPAPATPQSILEATAQRLGARTARAAPASTNTSLTVRTRDDGLFLIAGSEIGQYVVSVAPPGYVIPAQQTVESPSQGIVFTCAPNGRIVGRVIDDEANRPVATFSVGLAQNPDDVLLPKMSCRAFGPPKFVDGRFEMIDVRPGKYWLVAMSSGYAGGRSAEIVVAQGERKEGIEIRLVRGATIRGRVVDSAGKPIAGATVQGEPALSPGFPAIFTQGLRRDLPETKTQSDGTYALAHMLSGSYALSVSHPDFGPVATAAFTVPGVEDVLRPDVVMSRGATLRGRVTLADGRPDTSAMVLVGLVGGTQGFSQRTGYTDAEGRFEVKGLAVGQYRVNVTQRAGQPSLDIFKNAAKPYIVALGEGESKEIDL